MISIGELAKRSGVASSALRFYEERGLIESVRPEGSTGQRRMFQRDVIRRVSFIRVAQNVGLSLDEIKDALDTLPMGRTPNKRDWEKLSSSWQPILQRRIDALTSLRDKLTSCVGCGCLSLKSCALYNPNDAAAELGDGPRYLLGNNSKQVLSRLQK